LPQHPSAPVTRTTVKNLASPRDVALGVFAAIDAHDLDAIAAHFHPDNVEDFTPIGVFEGRSAVVGLFAEFFRALPDLTMTVEHVVADDHAACVRWRLVGTFSGEPFQGIQPTGTRIDLRGTDAFIELEDGLIRHNTIFYDGAAFARQIGLLPARGSWLEWLLIGGFNIKTRLLHGAFRVLSPR
jgi:steroid delta-isomerase-like uncharacterized protein